MSSRHVIDQVLSALHRSSDCTALARLALWYVSLGLFALGVALVMAQAGMPGAGLVWIALALVLGAGVWLRAHRRLRSVERLASARLAESLAPELGTAASSAVDLQASVDSGTLRYSRDLCELHLDQTADALGRADLAERLSAREKRPRRRAIWVVAACAAWAIFLLAMLDTGRGRLGRLLLDPGAASFSDVPLAGDITITYRYPAYTGLPPRIVEGGDGSIAAVTGTEVEIQAVADMPVRAAQLKVADLQAQLLQEIPMQLAEERGIAGRLSILRDARYHFALTAEDGDRLEERQSRPIRAVLDAFPEIHLDAPATDVELKDDKAVDILWRAKDDFGVAEVALVVEQPGVKEPRRILLAGAGEAAVRREGRFRWSVAEMKLQPGAEARFFLEALDNDAVSGAKRSVSATRRLSLFSARKHHEQLLAWQREILDALVDWLAADLTSPFSPGGNAAAFDAQVKIVGRIDRVRTRVASLIAALREDELTEPGIVAAFENVGEHVETAHRNRSRALLLAKRPTAAAWASTRVATLQRGSIAQLEKDIIYLDDLLALQRIDELKATAQDLLAAQRNLQELLDEYRETQDPALRAALEQQIRELRRQMGELLAKMARIKEGLPGEYRNLEAASMLKLGDQLDRLEQLLKKGDLEAAAQELEQLANMLENMVNSINDAEERFGGERYAQLRHQLAEFADEFRRVESQQKALSERADKLLKEYRREAIERAGKNLDDLVEKARKRTAEALEQLDEIVALQEQPHRPRLHKAVRDQIGEARERLLDVDALLESRDLAEARDAAHQAERNNESVDDMISDHVQWAGRRADRSLRQSERYARRSLEKTRDVRRMLDKLFPDPSNVLTPEQMAQLQRMAKKQESVRKEAERLGQRMEALAQEMPLFGGEPRQSLRNAQGEMQQAVGSIRAGELPGAAGHKRRAADELGRLRDALEKASQGGQQGGLPLPLGMSGSSRSGSGATGDLSREDVEIPQMDRNRAAPRFRQDLLEAAKQKPPSRFEEAVRRYYEELIK